ncbi:MAG: PD-(D/E)XK motif protein [Candidatus Xenobiia bacterium LiM19]
MMTRRLRMSFESRWESLEPGRGFQRIDQTHPLDFYLGVEDSGERVLLLVTDREVDIPSQSRAIQVLCRRRHDGRWALIFRLIHNELNVIFSHLCEDIVKFCRNLPEGKEPTAAVLRRFIHWQKLLERDRMGLLDETSIRGLIGEILFLYHSALPFYGAFPAVEGWVGPLDAINDFHFSDRIVEVKTHKPGSSKVIISSAEQLEHSDIPLHLVAVALSSAARGTGESFCLPEIVETVRHEIENSIAATQLFEERLLSAGYFERDEYRGFIYRLDGFRYFNVTDGFPRIIRSELPEGIGSVKYELDLAACGSFEINSERGELQ